MALMESSSSRRYVVGYALAPKKQQSFIQHSLISLAGSRGIDLLPIDPLLRLSSQGPFDLILHKLYSPEWKSELHDFAVRYPNTPVIDQPDAIERLRNRISMLQVVSELEVPQEAETYGIPKQVVVYDPESLSDPGSVETLRFPVIAKPLVADGSAKSHKMALVFHREGLLKLKPPIVLQEFVNHGGVIFKVYVVGDYVKCVKRKSLPDVTEDLGSGHLEASVSFSQVSNVGAAQDRDYETKHLEEAEMPPLKFITEIARGLRKALGLHLFNFDVIRDVRIGNHYLVIDINYFPGYAKMPAYEQVLTDFMWNVVHEQRVTVDCDDEIKNVSSNRCRSEGEMENAGS